MNIESIVLIFQVLLLLFIGFKFYRKVILNRVKFKV